MGETNGNSVNGANLPQLNVLVQYIKDLSFENPQAPNSLRPLEKAPNISVQFNVRSNPLNDTDSEVVLKLEGNARDEKNILFKVEVEYAGIFRLLNIPVEHVEPVLMIECPRLLFPFARQIVASVVNNGGFPTFYLDPIDFAAFYNQRKASPSSNADNVGAEKTE